MANKILDLDAKYGTREPVPTEPFKFLGRTWNLQRTFNTVAFGRVQAAPPEEALGAYVEYIVGMVIPDERHDFARALADANLDDEKLATLSRDLTEAATAPVPTKLPSDSSATPKKRVSARRSTAS